MKVRVRMQHKSAAIRNLKEISERMFQLGRGAGNGCTVVPWTEGGGARFLKLGKAAYRRKVWNVSQPFGVEPVETWEEARGRVVKCC